MLNVKVRLTRKLAECIDGVDLSHREVGDTLDVSQREARLLMAEGWAVSAQSRRRADRHARGAAADEPPDPDLDRHARGAAADKPPDRDRKSGR